MDLLQACTRVLCEELYRDSHTKSINTVITLQQTDSFALSLGVSHSYVTPFKKINLCAVPLGTGILISQGYQGYLC